MIGVYAILGISDVGWVAARTLGLGLLSLVLLTAFVVRQTRIENPLMPLRLFRSRNVTGANLVIALSTAGMFAMFFLGALYLQRVLRYTPLEVGLAFLPSTLAMGTISLRYTERLATRFGPRRVLTPGLAFICLGLLLFARTPVDGGYLADVLAPVMCIGVGAGLAFPSLFTLAMSGASAEDSGLASGIVNSAPQIGGAVGLALLATLSASRTDTLLAAGETAAEALNGGYHLAYLVGALLVGASLVVALAILRSEPLGAEEPGADEAVAALSFAEDRGR